MNIFYDADILIIWTYNGIHNFNDRNGGITCNHNAYNWIVCGFWGLIIIAWMCHF